MTDKILEEGKSLKSKISNLESQLAKLKDKETCNNVTLYNYGTLIDDVRKVYEKHLEICKQQFKEL